MKVPLTEEEVKQKLKEQTKKKKEKMSQIVDSLK